MSREFGQQLQQLRTQRGLTCAQLACQTCVSARSIAYWETGQHEPRENELRTFLAHLRVPEAEQLRLLQLLTATHGQKILVQMAQTRIGALKRLDVPTLGDLLGAIRSRRGLKREQAATVLGVSVSTLTRWENNRFQPNDETITQYGLHLGAYPQEMEALRARRLAPLETEPAFSLPHCEQLVETLLQEIHRPASPRIDLLALTLKRRLWLLAIEHPEALPFLAQVDYHYSHWLFFQDRSFEARRYAQEALEVLTTHTQPHLLWVEAIHIAVACRVETTQNGVQEGLSATKTWLKRIPQPHLQPYLLCDMALYNAQDGQFDTALQWLKQSLTVSTQALGQFPSPKDYIQLTTARVLLVSVKV